METEDILAIGVVGLILWLLMRKHQAPPVVPKEEVTSTITYGGETESGQI